MQFRKEHVAQAHREYPCWVLPGHGQASVQRKEHRNATIKTPFSEGILVPTHSLVYSFVGIL